MRKTNNLYICLLTLLFTMTAFAQIDGAETTGSFNIPYTPPNPVVTPVPTLPSQPVVIQPAPLPVGGGIPSLPPTSGSSTPPSSSGGGSFPSPPSSGGTGSFPTGGYTPPPPPPTPPIGGGTSGGGGSYAGQPPTPPTNPPSSNTGSTNPPAGGTPPPDPCRHTRAVGTAIKTDLDWLKTKTGERLEFGVEVRSSKPDGVNTVYATQQKSSTNQYSIVMEVSGSSEGDAHSHPLDSHAMFSFQDVRHLLSVYDIVLPSRQANVFVMVVCKDASGHTNVYNLKINNVDMLRAGVKAVWDNIKYATASIEDDKIKAIHDDQAIIYNNSNGDLEKSFLQQFGSFGVSLYKAADDSLANWERLNLGGNPDPSSPNKLIVIKTPCNN
jgi:hypothetical protein